MDLPGLSEMVMALGEDEFGEALMTSVRSLCNADMCSAFALGRREEMRCLLSNGGATIAENEARGVSNAYAQRFWRRDPIFRDVLKSSVSSDRVAIRRLYSNAIEDREYSRIHRQSGVVERVSLYRFQADSLVILSLYRREETGGFTPIDLRGIRASAECLLSLVAKHGELASAKHDCRRHPPIPLMKRCLMRGTDLSEREAETCAWVVIGGSAKEIARHTGLSLATITTYRKRAYQKLGVSDRLDLARCYDAMASFELPTRR